MQFRDYYDTLGVSRSASNDEIKRAYRRMARKYHPDVSSEPEAEDKFKAVAEAYEVLRDESKREAYDRLGSNWKSGDQFRPPPGWSGGFSGGSGGFGDGDSGDPFSEFFESLFGGARRPRPRGPDNGANQGAFGAGHPFGAGNGAKRPRNQPTQVELTLEEAYAGCEKQFSYAAASADGTKLKVRIPAGVTDGQRIRVPNGRGVMLSVKLSAHRWFTVDGKDVHVSCPIAPWEAALGSKVSVPTLGGTVELKIPPGSTSGRVLRLRGRGLGAKDKGDQLVELKIVTPPASDDRRRELYEQMAQDFEFQPRPNW